MTKISVIVPVYNVEAYLPKCVSSLVKQTFTDFEVILVNDGSTDSSAKLCENYADQYPSLIKSYTKPNGGLSDARNFGMQYATGQYIMFLDSDDYLAPHALTNMYALTEKGNKKIVECDFYWEYPNKKIKDQAPKYASLKDYMIRGRVVAWNKLYLRTWLLDTKVKFPKGKLYEDQDFFFKLVTYLTDITDVAVDRECEVYYVQRQTSISYSETTRIADILWIYQDIIDFYQTKGLFETYYLELEYRFVRNLLGNVLLRKVVKLKDKQLKRQLLDQIWQQKKIWFPDFAKNPYLRQKSKVDLYLRCVNPLTYRLFYL